MRSEAFDWRKIFSHCIKRARACAQCEASLFSDTLILFLLLDSHMDISYQYERRFSASDSGRSSQERDRSESSKSSVASRISESEPRRSKDSDSRRSTERSGRRSREDPTVRERWLITVTNAGASIAKREFESRAMQV